MENKKILIAPSILSADFGRLEEEVKAIETAGADLLHLDIMDGHYVPNLTFGYTVTQTVHRLTKLPLDAHLMVTNPADYTEKMAASGVNFLSFHPETVFHPHRLITVIKQNGMKAGVALNPGTPLNVLNELLPELDFVLLMSVNPGFSGQKFIPSVTAKTAQLKQKITALHLKTLIEVDGGIDVSVAPQLINAGADILVSASYIFSQQDYSAAIRNLRNV